MTSTNQTMAAMMMSSTIQIKVYAKQFSMADKFDTNFIINATHEQKTAMKHIFDKITNHLNKQYSPTTFKIHSVDVKKSRSKHKTFNINDNDSVNESIKCFYTKFPFEKELYVEIASYFQHKVESCSINCKYMLSNNTKDPLECPIYYAMKEKYEYTPFNLNHLNEFIHFGDEYVQKNECKFKDECKSYVRLENGSNEINDLCHIKLYKHPPRMRNIKLQQNIHCMVFNKNRKQNERIYNPELDDDYNHYNYNEKDGYLNALMAEVIRNGYKKDLCLTEADCIQSKYTILNVVDEKMNSYRHKAMGSPLNRARMLALVLYTGCNCNYDLCASQRNGNYKKWKFFDYCLYWAITRLSKCESGSFSVYSGLNKVKLDSSSVSCGYFATYTSTSWNKNVAKSFMGHNEGMVIQIHPSFKDNYFVNCCDVSWISKFPDECEILFARTDGDFGDAFKCVVLEDRNGVQTVSLTNTNP